MKFKYPYKNHAKTYHVWYTMIWRCKGKTEHFRRYYGARGIGVCERWLSWDNFYEDMGDRPDHMTLERIDNDKGYSPENCKWLSHLENSQNKRGNVFITVGEETLTVSAWSRKIGMTQSGLRTGLLRHGEQYLIERVKSLQV